MANYNSELTGAQIESALTAINGVASNANNGKILCVNNGIITAKSAIEIRGGTIDALTIVANGTYTHAALGGYSPITVDVRSGGSTFAFLAVQYQSGQTCTCTDGTTTLQSDQTGNYIFAIPNAGTWTLSCGAFTKQVSITTFGSRITKILMNRTELEVNEARETLIINGRYFKKYYSDLSIACYLKIGSYNGPLYVSETSNGAVFVSQWAPQSPKEPDGTISYNGTTWYYSQNAEFMVGDPSYADPNIKINDHSGVGSYSDMATAAKDLLDYYFYVI